MTLEQTRVLILDDERDALEDSVSAISSFVPAENITAVTTEIEALNIIESGAVDLLFLDVEIPGSNGFVLADYIHKIKPELEYVFLTGHAELGEESYDHEPLSFLSKPVDMQRLKRTLERYIAGSKSSNGGLIAVDTGASGFLLLSPADILYIAKEGRQTVIHCKNEKHHVRYSLDMMETIFEDYGLFRVHQSILVSLDRIAQVQMSNLGRTFLAVLDNGEHIPVSRGKYARLREHLQTKGVRFI